MNSAESTTSRTRSRSSGISGAYCALTSTSGIRGTATESRGARHAGNQRDDENDDDPDNEIVHVAEITVDMLVPGPQAPACAGKGERPDRGADQGPEDVTPERHLENARRDRDERAHHGRDAADEHGKVVPPLEPPLRAGKPIRPEMEEPAVPLEQRPTSVAADRPPQDPADEVAEGSRERHHDIRRCVRRDVVAEEHDVL